MADVVFDWSDSVSYNVDDTVSYNNNFYDCIKECINIVPGQDDNSKFYWKAWDYLLGPDEDEIIDDNENPETDLQSDEIEVDPDEDIDEDIPIDLDNVEGDNSDEDEPDPAVLENEALISLTEINNIINAYIAPLYSSSITYQEGDIVANNYGLHKYTSGRWVNISNLQQQIKDQKSEVYGYIAPYFSSFAIYSTGDIVCYEGHLYRRKDNITYVAGPWNSENWDQIGDLQTQIKDINNNLNNYVQTSTLNNYIQKTDSKYENFPNNWSMTTFNSFCLSLITFSTTNNNIGRVFLGDFPSSWISDIPKEGRAVIEILDENYIHLILYTNDLHKYEYLFDDTNNSGWF